jgi:hypothetical protein
MSYQEENLRDKIESTCKGKNTLPDALTKLIAFEPTQEATLQGSFELHWFPDDILARFIIDAKMRARFAVFGKSADGYPYALWLDDTDTQRIIKLNSGDSATYLAHNIIDFIILLSMGHFEEGDTNPNFQPWIEETFSIKIPNTDAALLSGIKEKDAEFNIWMNKNCEGFVL